MKTFTTYDRILAIILICILASLLPLSAASKKISTQADFSSGNITNLISADPDGAAQDYLRLINTNPGKDGNIGDNLGLGTGMVFAYKRLIPLTETRGRNRFSEKILVNIEPISNAKTDWGDLRLTDDSGTLIPFRILNFEQPIDNKNTPVTLLFEANANQSTTTNYWLYYGNPNASDISVDTIRRFYIVNHDFEDGYTGWAVCTASTLNTACKVAISEPNSILPAGYVGYNSKMSLIAEYPEGLNEGNETNKWRAMSQTLTGPTADEYILNAYIKSISGAYDKNLNTYLRHIQSGSNAYAFIPAGVTDWTTLSLEFDTGATRIMELAAGMLFKKNVSASWRERFTYIDWLDLQPKYPLQYILDAEESAGYVTIGSFTSNIIDTGIASPIFKKITWIANTKSQGTSVYFQTRSGATVGNLNSAPWSSNITVNGADIPSTSLRYLQVRAFLVTTETAFTPVLNEIEVFYDLPAVKMAVYAPTNVMSGEYFDFRITVQDSSNATATSYTGNIALSPFPADATVSFLPGVNYSFTSADKGTALFQARKTSVGNFQIRSSATGLTDGLSGNINSLPGEATEIVMVSPPASINAGTPFSINIEARDKYGNIDTNSNFIITSYCSDSYPASISSSISLTAGLAILPNTELYSAPSQLIRLTAPSVGLKTKHTINVNPSSATSLRLSADPDQYKGIDFNLTLDTIDSFGNVASSNSPYTLNISSGNLSPNSGTLAAGTKTQITTIDTEGVVTISATAGTLSGNIGITMHPQTPADLYSFNVDAGSIQLAGVPFTLTIEARDTNLNRVTSYKGACRIVANIGTATPEFTTGYDFLDGFMAIPISLSGASDTVYITAYDLKDNSILGRTNVTVNSSTLDHFDVTTPSSVTAGASCSFEIRPRDKSNNLLTNYTGSVSITNTSTGGEVSCPTNYVFTTADKGIKSFTNAEAARFTKAEVVRISAEDSGRRGTSDFITVLAASATPKITTRPDKFTVELGESLSFNLTLTDIYNNPLDGFNDSVNLVYSDPTVIGPANYNFQSFENGFHRFLSQVRNSQLGSFTISVTEPITNASNTSEIINVISGDTANFNLFPSSITIGAGNQFSFDITASDTAGNLNILYNGSVRFSSLDTAAILPDDSTLVNGAGTFNATFKTAGTYELSARDTQNPSVVGIMNITVLASDPTVLDFEIQDADMIVDADGAPFPFTLHIRDAYGNHANYTGDIDIISTETNASGDLLKSYHYANQSQISDTWNFVTADVQYLTATGTDFPNTNSDRIVVNAGAADHITGEFPLSVYSEFFYPFKVQIVDIYGNSTPQYTDKITPVSSGPNDISTPSNHTFSAGDNGEFTFNLQWDRGTGNPVTTNLTFNDSGTLTDLTIPVLVDCPRGNNPVNVLANFWLSGPDRLVVASEPFGMFIRANTGRDKLADITGTITIDFEISDGEFWVNQGSGWQKSLTMTNQNTLNFQAAVTRTGYLSIIAKCRAEPLKTGTVSLVSRPNVIDSITIKADSPQYAGQQFSQTTEWWDYYKNYAETSTDNIALTALTAGGYTLDPSSILAGGRAGKFKTSVTSGTWEDDKFWSSSSETNIYHDKLLNQITIEGIYDEDFTDGTLDNPNWKVLTMNSANCTGYYNLDENVLYMHSIGNGNIFAENDWDEDNITDSYFYLYQDWPSGDTYNFDARLHVLRYWYDQKKRTNRSVVGLMMKDSAHATEPKYVCPQMQNTTSSGDFNMNTYSQITYRKSNNGTVYRKKINTNKGNSGTHPKWLRLKRTAANTYAGAQSNDEQTWYTFSGGSGQSITPNFGTGQKIGIMVCADSNTYPGAGWFTKFKIDRFYSQGIYTSVIYDTATSSVTYDKIVLDSVTPTGSSIQIEARSSNNYTAMPATWQTISGTNINIGALNNKRYFQYRLTLVPRSLGGGYYDQTPIVKKVTVTYDISPIGDTFGQRETVTLLASTTDNSISYGSVDVEIKGGTVDHLELIAPATSTAGVPFTITVNARDEFGNISDNASGTWHFTCSDGSPYPAITPPDYTLVPVADKGSHIFSKMSILYNGPEATISVTDGTLTATSTVILVSPGELKKFTVSGDSPQVASEPFELVVTAIDKYDNVKSDYDGEVTFYDDRSGGASKYNPIKINPGEWIGGLATLTPGVSFTKVEVVHITAQGDYMQGLSNDIQITSASSSALLMSVDSTQQTAGAPFSINVKALDHFGNQATDYLGTVNFSVTDVNSNVVIPSNYSYVVGDVGSHDWISGATLITPGVQTLKVQDTLIATITSEIPIVVTPGPVAKFTVSCSDIQTAGSPFNLLITAYDAYGNLKTDFSEAVGITSTFTSILPVTAGGFSNGQLLIPSVEIENGTLPATGDIVVSYGTGIGTTSVTILPSASTFSHFFLEAIPFEPIAGDAFKLTIKAVGLDGAVFTGYAGTGVNLSASNTFGIEVTPPMSPNEATDFINGIKEVYARIWEAGDDKIWAHDKTLEKVGSLSIKILPTNLSYFAIIPGTSTASLYPNVYYQNINEEFPLYLAAYDSIDNLKSDYTGSVQLSSNGTGTLSVASITFVGGLATVPAIIYDDWGKIRISCFDNLLDKTGKSNYIYFFGPLASFNPIYGTIQSDETPFLTTIEAYDIYGQLKKNCMDNTSLDIANISYPAGISPVTISPMVPTLDWVDGIAYEWFTANRKDTGSTKTVSFIIDSDDTANASGSVIISLAKKGSTATHFIIETYSPQTAGKYFPMAVKAVDANEQIDPTWTGTITLTASDTGGIAWPITPSTITIGGGDSGVFTTTTMLIDNPATYTITATSDSLTGSFHPMQIKQRAIAELSVTMPEFAPLNQNFEMSIQALDDLGNLITDYIPEGSVLLKLNATATGLLGVQFADPTDFVNGIATITVQTYNKSQTIWVYAREPYLNTDYIGGPTDVFGIPAKLVLEPLDQHNPPNIDVSRLFYWRNFFRVRATVKDSNGFIVANFDNDLHFTMLQGAPPTATDQTIMESYDIQHMDSINEGIQDFTLKVDYSTMVSPINLRLVGSFTYAAIETSREIGDLPFYKIRNFDHYRIDSPTSTSGAIKGATFTFQITAIDNFDDPITLAASYPIFIWGQTQPATSATNIQVTPAAGTIDFSNKSQVTMLANIDYDDMATTTFLFNISPSGSGIGSDTVEFPVRLGEPKVNSQMINVDVSTHYVLSMYIKTVDELAATGTAGIEVALYDNTSTNVLMPPKTFATLIAEDGSSGVTGTSTGHHGWKRYFWHFTTDADTPKLSIKLGTNAGVVYIDGVQLEKVTNTALPFPSKYSPHPLNIIHPALDKKRGVVGQEYWKQ